MLRGRADRRHILQGAVSLQGCRLLRLHLHGFMERKQNKALRAGRSRNEHVMFRIITNESVYLRVLWVLQVIQWFRRGNYCHPLGIIQYPEYTL